MSGTVLVVEDELLIALDVMDELDLAGFEPVGPFADVGRALEFCQRRLPDCAVLDIRLRDGESYPLADWLSLRDVPVVFHSGHAQSDELKQRYPGAGICPKPALKSNLVGLVAQLCASRPVQAST